MSAELSRKQGINKSLTIEDLNIFRDWCSFFETILYLSQQQSQNEKTTDANYKLF